MSGRRRDARYRLAIPQAGWLRLAVIETAAGPAFDRDRTSALPVRLLDVSLTGCLLGISRTMEVGVAGELVVALGGGHFGEVVRLRVLEREQTIAPKAPEPAPGAPLTVYQSVFLSYGGPDEDFAATIYRALVARGVDVFFFPETARLGQRIHRTISQGVHDHDRVVLICSEQSLNRPGVLNEIEQVLDREAAEGGTERLLPIALDDYVKRWSPPRLDLARQVQQRVTAFFPSRDPASPEYEKQFARLLHAITVKG